MGMKTLLAALLVSSLNIASSFAFNNAACEPDSQRYCLGLINQDTAKLTACLREHEKDLLPPCRAKIMKKKESNQ